MKRLIVYTVSALLMASCGGHKQTVRTVPDGSESAIYDSKSEICYGSGIITGRNVVIN